MKKSKILITIIIILLILACVLGIFFLVNNKNNKKVGSVHQLSSEKELEEIIKGEKQGNYTLKNIILDILGGKLHHSYYDWPLYYDTNYYDSSETVDFNNSWETDSSSSTETLLSGIADNAKSASSNSKSTSTSGEQEYSKTIYKLKMLMKQI